MYRVRGPVRTLLLGSKLLQRPTHVANVPIALARCSSSGGNFSMDQLLPAPDAFTRRHVGPDTGEQKEMLKYLGLEVRSVYNGA